MTRRLLAIVYPGVVEWELTFPLFCISYQIAYEFASISNERVSGSMGLEVEAPACISEVAVADFDGVYLPGGTHPQRGGFNTDLCTDEGLLQLLRTFAGAGKVVAALCGAPVVLGAAGLLDGRRFAGGIDNDKGWLDKGVRVTGEMAADGNILTASLRGAFPFAAGLARALGEEQYAREIEEFFVFPHE